ncbi:hypothetical protein R5R35_002156 [Gryllus longicercus]|uniref:Uncharacterized protein n=1 Tax=Gryllus longicercus TaxID=2509291 RepID=A0AAN9Z406_9ORTH
MIPMLRRGAAYDRMSASAPADWLRCSHSDGWAVSPGSTAPYLSTYMWDYSRLRTPPPPLPPPPPPPASLGGPPLRLVNAIRLSELSGGGNLHRCAALGPDCVRLCCARAYRLPRYVSWDPCRQAHVLGMRPAPAACRLLQAR